MRTCTKAFSLEVTGGCPSYLAGINVGSNGYGGCAAITTSNAVNPNVFLVSGLNNTSIYDADTYAFLTTVNNSVSTGWTHGILHVGTETVWCRVTGSFCQIIDANLGISLTELDDGGNNLWDGLVWHSANNRILSITTDVTGDYFMMVANPLTRLMSTAIFLEFGGGDTPVTLAYSATQNRIYVVYETFPAFTTRIEIYDGTYTSVGTITSGARPLYGTAIWESVSDRVFIRTESGLLVLDCPTASFIGTVPMNGGLSSGTDSCIDGAGNVYCGDVTGGVNQLVVVDGATAAEICRLATNTNSLPTSHSFLNANNKLITGFLSRPNFDIYQ